MPYTVGADTSPPNFTRRRVPRLCTFIQQIQLHATERWAGCPGQPNGLCACFALKKATKPLYGRLRAFRVVLNLYGKGNGFLWTNPAVTERSRVDDPA